uniref:Chromosome 4 open reading frame 19 n=1 Tax=Salvator merianae TaxID=96440 RepID=A0A8D0B432_SALMN
MGCRCCKMIQSYIFDPEEVQQPSGYINEINNEIKNCKPDEQDGGKFKCKPNSGIQVHKNELQNAEIQPAATRHKLNNAKDGIWNHKNTSPPEERLENSVGKYNYNVNGICSGIKSHANPSVNQNKENSIHSCSDQQSDSSTKGENCETLESEERPKLSLEMMESVSYDEAQNSGGNCSPTQIAIPQAQGNGMLLSGLNHMANPNQAAKHVAAGSEYLLNSHTPRDLCTECPATIKHRLMGESKSSALADKGCRRGPSNACLKDRMCDETPSPGSKRETQYGCHNEANGELEEIDAEVAEALAALEAATAGEEFEDEEDY